MRCLGIFLVIGLATASQTAAAAAHRDAPQVVTAVSVAEFEALKRDFAELARRLDAMEAENAQLRAGHVETQRTMARLRRNEAAPAAAEAATNWTNHISLSGDFRYRYEYTTEDRAGANNPKRNRIRARPVLKARLPADVEIGFGLATGSTDPSSANQTLGEFGQDQDIALDLAYVDWGTPIDRLHLFAGKFKNQFIRAGNNGLLWDGDWRPEGVHAVYASDVFFGSLLGNWIQSSDGVGRHEEFSWGVQGGIRTALGPTKIRAGAMYFDFPAKGNSCYFEADDCRGNTAVPDLANPGDFLYAFDYELIEGFLEVDFDAFGLPSQFFVDYVRNQEADSKDTGYAVGLRVGRTAGRGSWQAGYLYQDLEADAVLGLLTDSDIAGGGTDSKGHKLSAAYAFTDVSRINLTYFDAERQDSNGVENGGEAYDVDTLFVDFEWKYK